MRVFRLISHTFNRRSLTGDDDMKKCDIVVYDVAEKRIAGTLDVEFLNSELRLKDSIYSSLTGKTRE